MEIVAGILLLVIAALASVVLELWLKVRMLEQAVATLAPAHSVEAVDRKVEKLEGQAVEGFNKAAQAIHNVSAQANLVMAAVKLHRAEVEETYVKRAEVN